MDGRIPKYILYGELTAGICNLGCPHVHYQDVSKQHVMELSIDKNKWEELAIDCSKWRSYIKTTLKFGKKKESQP